MIPPFERDPDRWRDETRDGARLPDSPMQLPGDPGASNPNADPEAHPSIEVNVPARNRDTAAWTHDLRTITVTVGGPDDKRLLIYDRTEPTAWIRSSAQVDIAKAYGPCPPGEAEDEDATTDTHP